MHDYDIIISMGNQSKNDIDNCIVEITIISGTIYRSAKCLIVTKPAGGLGKMCAAFQYTKD